MRAVIQRVSEASVLVGGEVCGDIGRGLLVYVGVDRDDGDKDIEYLADKIRHLRIFPDEADRMNLNVVQAGGQALIVSAFTVSADARSLSATVLGRLSGWPGYNDNACKAAI